MDVGDCSDPMLPGDIIGDCMEPGDCMSGIIGDCIWLGDICDDPVGDICDVGGEKRDPMLKRLFELAPEYPDVDIVLLKPGGTEP